MRAMAIRATGGTGSAQSMAHAMDARRVLFGRSLMARGAIDGLGDQIIVRMFGSYIGMATDTGVGLMHCPGENGFINKKRDLLAGGVRFTESFIGMAIETAAVGI